LRPLPFSVWEESLHACTKGQKKNRTRKEAKNRKRSLSVCVQLYPNVQETSLPKVIWEEGRVAALSHTYAVKSPLVTMARPKFAPKVLLPVDRSQNPTTCLIPGPVRPTMPNGIRIRSTVFPQCTEQTDRPTDRSFTGKFDRYRPLR